MNQSFGNRIIRYPAGHSAVLDLTKPPFCAVPDGKTDCTEAFRKALDFVTGAYKAAYLESVEKLRAMQDDNALISFEIRKVQGRMNVPFPEHMPKGYIIYLPKGRYLVRDTISYSHEDLYDMLYNIRWLEMCALIRIVGESREETVIQLADDLPAFSFGARRPVINFCKGEKTGVAMSNSVQNLTIDVGSGNPGAVGLRFICNNTGLVADVTIRSSDPSHRGYAGLEIVDEKVSCAYVKNLSVDGFDYAIRLTSQQHNVAMEHISIRNQRIAGLYQMGSALSLRDLRSENRVPAVHLLGYSAHLTLVDSALTGGSTDEIAINAEFGYYYIRNVKIAGYGRDLNSPEQGFGAGLLPYECHSDSACSLVELDSSVCFDTSDMPDSPRFSDDRSCFVSVAKFGAVGDGIHDDTTAIQAAMNSGAEGVLFETGCYLITKPIFIPPEVTQVDFMFCDLRVGDALARDASKAAFVIRGDESPIRICNLFAWEQFHGRMTLLDHAGKRTLVMELLHTQGAPMYKNSVTGGCVFINGCACTVGGIPGTGGRSTEAHNTAGWIDARDIPCFSFRGQTVYARQINPERALTEIVNDGGKLFILGFKTEEEGTAFDTRNGGITEVLGGMCCIGMAKDIPLVRNEDSHALVVLSTMINNSRQRFPIAVQEIRNGKHMELRDADMPIRAMQSYYIPKYQS